MSFSRGSSQPRPLALQADSLQSEPPGKPWRTVWKLLKTKIKSKSRTTIGFSNPTPGHVSGESHSLKRYAYTVSVKLLSRVWLFAIPWTVAYQAPPSTELCRQEYWSGLSFPSPGDLPDPGSDPRSPHYSQTHYCLSHQKAPTLLCLKWITNKDNHRDLCSKLCRSLCGRRVWGRMVTCIWMAESLCHSPETITAFLIDYNQYKIKSFKKGKKRKDTFTPMVIDIAAPFIIAKTQKQLKCPLAEEWIKMFKR